MKTKVEKLYLNYQQAQIYLKQSIIELDTLNDSIDQDDLAKLGNTREYLSTCKLKLAGQ